jgi:hypothetical protein
MKFKRLARYRYQHSYSKGSDLPAFYIYPSAVIVVHSVGVEKINGSVSLPLLGGVSRSRVSSNPASSVRPPELLSEADDSLGTLVLLLPALVLVGGVSERINIYNSDRRIIFHIQRVLIIKTMCTKFVACSILRNLVPKSLLNINSD